MTKTLKKANSLLAERSKIQKLIAQSEQAVKQSEAAVATALERVGLVEAETAMGGAAAADDGDARKARQVWALAIEAVEVAAARVQGLQG